MTMTSTRPVRVGVVVFDGAEELDVVGPYEVLTSWAARSSLHPEVVTFSRDGSGVVLAKGLRIVPDRSADEASDLHVLVHPGGPGARALVRDPDHLAWVRAVRRTTPLLTSVSTGALVLAAAGVLAGRPVTTHHRWVDELVDVDPSALVDTEARFVDDGDVVTAAGASAGIDMALHLVERLESAEIAHQVRRDLGHDPSLPS